MARKTGQLIPEFTIKTIDGEYWDSHSTPAGNLTLLTVYRGKWCPNCKWQLQQLERLHGEFVKRGVTVIAVSADTEERAKKMANDYGLENLKIGYDMPIETARELGLFISKGIEEYEMPFFCEPGSFIIDKNSNLFAAWIASNAFARSNPEDLLAYIDFINKNNDRAPRGSD